MRPKIKFSSENKIIRDVWLAKVRGENIYFIHVELNFGNVWTYFQGNSSKPDWLKVYVNELDGYGRTKYKSDFIEVFGLSEKFSCIHRQEKSTIRFIFFPIQYYDRLVHSKNVEQIE